MKTNTLLAGRSVAMAVVAGVMFLAGGGRAQNLFVTDEDSGNIYEYTPGGLRSTFASGLTSPTGLAFDSSGDLFVACGGPQEGSIVEITPGGVKSTFASSFANPFGLAFDSAGDLFASGTSIAGIIRTQGAASILKFTPDGTKSSFASGLLDPSGLAFNSAGNLYVGSASLLNPLRPTVNSITEITPSGTKSIFATGFSNAVDGLAFNSAGSLYVSAFGLTAGTGSIDIISPDGTKSTFATGFYEPRALAFDSAGDLFVANSEDNDIIEIAPNGTETTFAQGLDFPFGIAFAPVPEPSELALAVVGILILLVVRRFHSRATTFIRCRKTRICLRSRA